jgi:hypothetical protein
MEDDFIPPEPLTVEQLQNVFDAMGCGKSLRELEEGTSAQELRGEPNVTPLSDWVWF